MSSTATTPGAESDRQLREMNQALLVSSIRQHELTEKALQSEAAVAGLAAIVTYSEDAIVSKNIDGIIQSWNRGAERLFGYTAQEVIGKSIAILIPADHTDEEPLILDRIRHGQPTEHFETVRRRKDGSLLDISLTVSPLRDTTGRIIGASKVARDITDRKRSELLLALQKEVLELAAVGGELESILHFAVQSTRQYFGEPSRASLFLLAPDGQHLKFAAAAGLAEAYTLAVDNFDVGPNSPSCGQAAHTGSPAIVPDVTRDPLWAPLLSLAREHEIAAVWSIPLRTIGGKVLGTIALYHRKPRTPTPAELDAVNLIGQTVALVVERKRESERRKQAEETLRESEVRYRRLFQSGKDGILILDAATGKIVDANAFMSGLLGQDLSSLLGKELHEIGMFEDAAANKAAFKKLQEIGYIRYDHLPVQRPDGQVTPVEFVSNVYKEGERLVAQCNVRDISARVALERQVKLQAEALVDQARQKDEFLAMLAHELRNPLAPIRSATHLLRLQERGKESLIQQQAREVIERQVTTLTRLVSDLLEVSRALTGQIRLTLETLDLNQVVMHAIETAKPVFEQRGHSLSVTLSPDPQWISADSTRLEEVFVNLLVNAAKYTNEGGHISVDCEQLPRHAAIHIRDNGAGIEPSLLPRIFDLFTQGNRTLDRSQGGLGIGLSLAHRVVELHSGTIEAHSQGPGTGSEFIVRLPHTNSLDTSTPIHADETTPAHSLRILVVDDNVDACLMLANLLRSKGHSVHTAHTGPTAITATDAWHPHVLLLDIGLPGLDGYEVARRLRAAPSTRDVKLIAVTGYGTEKDVELGREAGFNAHLVKPVELPDIERLLAAWQPQP